MQQNIPLSRFVAWERQRIDEFERMWKRESAADPESFPPEMWPGDWADQIYDFPGEDIPDEDLP